MRQTIFALALFALPACAAQQSSQSTSAATPTRTQFHIRYINGKNAYIDGGRNAGLSEGTTLVLKQDPTKPANDAANVALEPGVVARLTVVSVATSSAVCEVVASARELAVDDVVSMPDVEVEKLVEKDTLGNTRQYPMVVSFSQGDPLDEEIREAIPHPPLPEINQMRGRIGFDMSTIHQLGQGGASSSSYGMVFRGDFSRLFGTHWNLNGYWRGNLQSSSAQSQPSMQDLINRTYLMSFAYVNPNSRWTAGIGRLYLPWASSLETIDGGFVGRQLSSGTVAGVFAGSTPDPTAWNYNPNRKIGGVFVNAHGGSFENFRYSTTAGAGVNLLGWGVDRPFLFTENNISFKRYFSLYHSMQIDRPTANPSMPAVAAGLGQSLLSLRIQVIPRVAFDVTDTYFRDVPTYDPSLVGTGLLDKYLYQGLNGGARIEFPRHVTGYFSLGRSSSSNDTKSSLNSLFGVSVSHIWRTGLQADVRYSKFDSAFASGTYRSVTISRDLGDRLRLDLQGGRYAYTSSLAANSGSYFANMLFDTNVGSRYFIQSGFTTQRGGTQNYNQWITTFGYRFDNRAAARRAAHANQP
jgi:hypothetical protein